MRQAVKRVGFVDNAGLAEQHPAAHCSAFSRALDEKICVYDVRNEPSRRKREKTQGRPTALYAQQKMAAVISAGREQFILNGYRNTTMDAIALQAGISKRSLYFWHADKAALFLACTLEGSRQLPQPTPDPNHDIGQGLKAYAARLVERLSRAQNYGMAQLLAREGRDFPELAEAVGYGDDVYLVKPLAEFLKLHGFEAARAQTAAQLFVAMVLAEIDRAILLAQPIATSREIAEHAEFVTNIFLFGCLGRQ